MDATEFWFRHFTRRLLPEQESPTTSYYLPMRCVKSDKKPARTESLRIGAKDVFYIATPTEAHAIGVIDLPSRSEIGLTVVPTEIHSARRYLAKWLLSLDLATFQPMMIGMVSKSDPEDSFVLSTSPHYVTFCAAGGSSTFSLPRLQQASRAFADMHWKTVSGALHQMARLRRDPNEHNRKKLMDMLIKMPTLEHALAAAGILGGSPEHEMLGWANIERAEPGTQETSE